MDLLRRQELDAELKRLNDTVTRAVHERTAWMDAHMTDYSDLQIGDKIYDLTNLRCVGTVTDIYRYWGTTRIIGATNGERHPPRDPQYDTSMDAEYEFMVSEERNIYDNTSSYGGSRSFGSEKDYINRLRLRAEMADLKWEDVFK